MIGNFNDHHTKRLKIARVNEKITNSLSEDTKCVIRRYKWGNQNRGNKKIPKAESDDIKGGNQKIPKV